MHPTTKSAANIQESLLALSRNLSDSFALDSYLDRIAEHSSKFSNSEASSILLFEKESGLLKFVAAPPSQKGILKRTRVPLEGSIAGRAFSLSRPVIVQNGDDRGGIYSQIDRVLNFETRSLLAVPIIYREKTLGVLETVNKRLNAHYTEEDVTILETFASFAANAIFNTILIDEVDRTNKSMKEFDRLKSNFIATTSHEMRTPLGLILGHASFLRDFKLDEQTNQQLDVIIRNAKRLKKIFNDLSSIHNNQNGRTNVELYRVSVNKFVEDVCRAFKGFAGEKGIYLESALPESEITVQMDEEKMYLALSNLIENAINSSEQGDRVMIVGEMLPEHIKISVIDKGNGIPVKEISKVFERFYRVEAENAHCRGGMGLGLTVAKVMVEAQGGQIWAESEPGVGSKFTILLPTDTHSEKD